MIRGGCLSGKCYDFAMPRLEWRVQYDLKDDSTLGDAMRLLAALTTTDFSVDSSHILPIKPWQAAEPCLWRPAGEYPLSEQPLPAREAGAAAICATALRTTFGFDHLARCSAI